ncbi:MAG: DUF3575 domain-containing protein [Bacteroides sp.]|nr:DUF3575 domain-containing protein [Bacteroides sp.]
MKIYFRQGKIDLIPSLSGNQSALDRIADSLRTSYADSVYRLQKILVVGGASPEGSVKINQWLSEKRAGVLFDYLSSYGSLPDSLKTTLFLGRDWDGLIRLVEDDRNVPYQEETLDLLRQIADEVRSGIHPSADPLRRIQQLRGGAPYSYMYRNLFPELRASHLYLWYKKTWNPLANVMTAPPSESQSVMPLPADTVYIIRHDTVYLSKCCPFYMAVKTNLLYDALAVPNVGVEFYLGKQWSIAANWMYAWWKTDRHHRYWRIYGGDIALRRWFGKAAKEKPLTGHHIGLYGQVLTYDFEWGGTGYMAGEPGGNILDRANYAVGLEYGYSLPIARRLNLDFTIGLGYMGGKYYEYKPEDDCYVWQATKNRHYFGPTKLEVSLVWLLGCDNYNRKKGGKR